LSKYHNLKRNSNRKEKKKLIYNKGITLKKKDKPDADSIKPTIAIHPATHHPFLTAQKPKKTKTKHDFHQY